MTYKHHTKLDLVEGGNIFKQGDHPTLKFIGYDSLGNEADLTGKQIEGALFNRNKGIIYEASASFADGRIVFTINELLDNGKFQLEFTVTDSTDPNYRAKFPSDEYAAELTIKPSKDNMDFVGVSMTTVAQLRFEQENKQQQFEQQIVPQVDEIKTEQQRLQIELYNAAAALTEDSEFALAKGTYGSVPERLNSSDQRLADMGNAKISKGQVAVSDIDKNKGLLDQTYLSDTLKQQIAGTAPINAVPADNSITTVKMANGSITTEKIADSKLAPRVLSGIKSIPTVNLFNKDTVRTGGYYLESDGSWRVFGGWNSSDFIPVTAGEKYKRSDVYGTTFWDANQVFISGVTGTTVTVPASAAFAKIAVKNTDLNTMMFTKLNSYPSQYIPFNRYGFDTLWNVMDGVEVEAENVEGITETGTVNLFNPSTVTTGGYIDTDGSFKTNSGWVVSDFIPVVEGKLYKRSGTQPSTFYDANKNYISGNYGTQAVPSPKGTAFVRISMQATELNTHMLTLDKEFPSYYIPHKLFSFDGKWNVQNTPATAERFKAVEKKTADLDKIYSAKYSEPIRLELKEFSGYSQPYHPSVVYIPGGFNGYKYWMSSSPIPTAGQPYPERFEVPVVHKSNDGINWTVVESANPLDDLTAEEITNTDYMSDPHNVYRPDTQTLEVWYRLTRRATGEPTTVFRRTTTDGVNWTARETMVPETVISSGYMVQSPSIIWDNTRKVYRLWYYNAINASYYNEIPEGGVYVPSNQVRVNLDVNLLYHHIDVNFFNGEYHFIGYHAGTPQNITHYTSTDGINFVKKKVLIETGTGHFLYSGMLYRSVSLLNEQGKVMLYFSFNTNGQRGVGLIIADSFADIHTVKRIDSKKVLLDSGITLEELAAEVVRLRNIVEA